MQDLQIIHGQFLFPFHLIPVLLHGWFSYELLCLRTLGQGECEEEGEPVEGGAHNSIEPFGTFENNLCNCATADTIMETFFRVI